jgi:hypothetical protein
LEAKDGLARVAHHENARLSHPPARARARARAPLRLQKLMQQLLLER